jgi:glyoxylase-like metal-dependent hydrolase (beta-lactamase superfamily II)
MAVNTHCHFDHVGRNWQFADGWYWPAQPSTASAQQGQTHAQVGEYVADGCNCAPYPADFCPEEYAIPPYPHWQPLHDGQIFDLGGRTVRVQHAPGHSPDSIVLVDDDNKLLFTGDTYYPAPLYTQMHSDTGMNGDFWMFRATMHALAQRYAEYTLYNGHNEPRRPGTMLCAAAEAFDAVAQGKAPFAVGADGLRRYTWGDVQILTAPGGPPAQKPSEQ